MQTSLKVQNKELVYPHPCPKKRKLLGNRSVEQDLKISGRGGVGLGLVGVPVQKGSGREEGGARVE